MLNIIPFASLIEKSSKGELIAAIEASCALFFPDAVPIPIKALPDSAIMERISAKSTFINPGFIIISDIPTTPCRKTSSATEKASCRGVFSGIIFNNLSLDTTINVSTLFFNSAIPSIACCILFFPSNTNGFVTTAIVKQPNSLAISAITGAAPDPVPPPIPAVMKTRSPDETISPISCLLSSAAFFPITGFPPAPKPRVNFAPMLHVFGAKERDRA
mmetsp:Transcript_4383/g.12921  ORF Transcript_4383/g.12921 Transcript_4383/m.12921 type:complete len:217 (+) Transcript_4383:7194-7844(+)